MNKLMTALLAVGALLAVACSGGDEDNGDAQGGGDSEVTVQIAAEDADRVAHEALPTLEDLPGENWQILGEDVFSEDDDSFLEFIEGTPECETLENLAALEGVFGGADPDEEVPAGRAQIEFEQQDPDELIAPNIEVEVEIDESMAGSRAEFTIVRELFQSEETSQCLVTVLNNQFAETGTGGLEVEVREGTGSADSPQDGALMAFDIDMSIAGIDLAMAMELYFWAYGNANVQVMFLGTNETLTEDLVQGVLSVVDENLRNAAGE